MRQTGEVRDNTRVVYVFGEFELDVARATLRRSDQVLPLRPQSFEVLRCLIERHGAVVSKNELIESVWHGAPVSDDSVTQCLTDIRKVLGPDAKTIIRTVPRRGFVFEHPVARREQGAETAVLKSSDRLKYYQVAGVAALVAVLVAGLYAWNVIQSKDGLNVTPATVLGSDNSVTSIAVLPFEDLSAGDDASHIGDGIAVEIIDRLSGLQGMRVITWASSYLAKQASTEIDVIGKSLNVGHVLTGSVRIAEERIRISAQLIDSNDGTLVWADSFEWDMTDSHLFDVQAAVASAVAEAISGGFAENASEPPRSIEALDRYQQGMYFLRQIETAATGNYDAAIESFEAAIKIDPDWSAPHASLGRVLHFRASGEKPPMSDEDFRQSKKHLMEAIRLDPDNAAAYESLGYVLFRADLDFEGAESAYNKAYALGGTQHWGPAILLRSTARFDEAIERYRQALERDPLSIGLKIQLAVTLACAGRYGESVAHFERLLEAVPDDPDVATGLVYAYLLNDEAAAAMVILDQYPDLLGNPGDKAYLYALLGREDEAESEISAAESSGAWRPRNVVPAVLLLGQKDRALTYLERAAESAPRSLLGIQCYKEVRELAGDRRYEQVLDQIGFPR